MLLRAFILCVGVSVAHAQAPNTLFVSSNVMTGQLWHPATSAGSGASGSCTTTGSDVNYFALPFFTDTSASTYSLSLFYESFQSGFVYLYRDAFNPQDPCHDMFVFGFAPVANITNIQLDANRQYFFVTSEDTLFGGGGSFQVTITGPNGSHLSQGNAPTPQVLFCLGDGSGAACPCGNNGASGNGCASSVAAGGAHLATSGTASVSADSAALVGSTLPNGPGLYFQGSAQSASPASFGDGLLCASGAIVRLGVAFASNSSSSYPSGAASAIHVAGATSAGDVRQYQVWYRDAAPTFCTPALFNLTNGVTLTWSP
jgi:hypothetical protein